MIRRNSGVMGVLVILLIGMGLFLGCGTSLMKPKVGDHLLVGLTQPQMKPVEEEKHRLRTALEAIK